MTHLRLVCPRDLVERVLAYLAACGSCVNIVRLEGAAMKPVGDVVVCDVAREDASRVIGDLEAMGLARRGSIAVEELDAAISEAAVAAEAHAPGAPADAVVWEALSAGTEEIIEFSIRFVVLMIVATLIAAAGVIRRRRRSRAGTRGGVRTRSAARAESFVGTLASRAITLAPDRRPEEHQATLFISTPNGWSVGVALLAGVAGMISISTAKSGALIGVLISVMTIPAAANVGVAAAYGDWHECGGAALQLVINLTAIVLSAVATLALQRAAFVRRRHRMA